MKSEITKGDSVGEAFLSQRTCGLRNQHLPSVRRCLEAGGPVHLGSEIVTVAGLCGAAVQRHPHPQRSDRLIPGGAGEPALGEEGRFTRIGSAGEDGEKAITPVLDDRPTVVADRSDQDLVVGCERLSHRLGTLVPEPAALFDVGEEECERAGRSHPLPWVGAPMVSEYGRCPADG